MKRLDERFLSGLAWGKKYNQGHFSQVTVPSGTSLKQSHHCLRTAENQRLRAELGEVRPWLTLYMQNKENNSPSISPSYKLKSILEKHNLYVLGHLTLYRYRVLNLRIFRFVEYEVIFFEVQKNRAISIQVFI